MSTPTNYERNFAFKTAIGKNGEKFLNPLFADKIYQRPDGQAAQLRCYGNIVKALQDRAMNIYSVLTVVEDTDPDHLAAFKDDPLARQIAATHLVVVDSKTGRVFDHTNARLNQDGQEPGMGLLFAYPSDQQEERLKALIAPYQSAEEHDLNLAIAYNNATGKSLTVAEVKVLSAQLIHDSIVYHASKAAPAIKSDVRCTQ